MGILPFDDWFYHLSYRKQEVTHLHREVLTLETDIAGREAALNDAYADLRRMSAFNGVLGLALQAVTLDDATWQQLKATIATALSKAPAAQSVLGDALKDMIAALGPAAAARAEHDLMAWKIVTKEVRTVIDGAKKLLLDPLLKDAITGLVLQIAGIEAEAVVEGVTVQATLLGIESATWATIATTGIGIVIAIGLDIIFDAINGAVQRDKLDDQIDKLNEAIDKLKAFRDSQVTSGSEIDKAIAEQRVSFAGLLRLLEARDFPDFAIAVAPATAPTDNVIDLQRSVMRRYGQFYVLREAVGSAVARNASVTADAVINSLLVGGPTGVTHAQLLWHWDVLAVVDPACAARLPAPQPDLVCTAIEAHNDASLIAAFRIRWVAPDGQTGTSSWSAQRLLAQSHDFDLAAAKVATSAQVRVEADPVGGGVVVSQDTTRFDPSSKRRALFRLRGSLVHANIVADDS